jgi:hypothetical protein
MAMGLWDYSLLGASDSNSSRHPTNTSTTDCPADDATADDAADATADATADGSSDSRSVARLQCHPGRRFYMAAFTRFGTNGSPVQWNPCIPTGL